MHGQIDKRPRADGTFSYRVRIELPKDRLTGKRKRISVSADSERALRAKVAEEIAKIQSRTRVDRNNMTVEQFCEDWLESLPGKYRPNSVAHYTALMRSYVLVAIGQMRMQDVEYRDIQKLEARLLKGGGKEGRPLSPRTVESVHKMLNKVFGLAVRWKVIGENPVSMVDPPRVDAPPTMVWTPAQAQAFIKVASADDYEPLWTLAIYTGMRRGEILGLHWSEVDLDAGVVRIVRSRGRNRDGKLNEAPPKTKASVRAVQLSPEVVQFLRSIRKARMAEALRTGVRWDRGAHVVLNQYGNPPSPPRAVRRLKQLCREAGLEPVKIHDLRHINASLLLRMRVSPKVVQERLGHSSVGITLGMYSHVLPDLHDEEAARMGGLFSDSEDDDGVIEGGGYGRGDEKPRDVRRNRSG